MANLLKMQDSLKNLSDDEIKNQLANPTGEIPSFLLAAELARREAMRAESAALPSKSVTEDLTAPPASPTGTASQMMAGTPPPLGTGAPLGTSAPLGTGAPPGMPPPQMMAGTPPPLGTGAPPGMPPTQMMAAGGRAPRGIETLREGGAVRMQQGGETPPASTWLGRLYQDMTAAHSAAADDYATGYADLNNRYELQGLDQQAKRDAAERDRVTALAEARAKTAQDLADFKNPPVPPIPPARIPPPFAPVSEGALTGRAPAPAAARRDVGLGGASAGYGGGSAGYGGAPAGGGSAGYGAPRVSAADPVTAAADAAKKEYDAALAESKPDAKQRKEDANARFYTDLGFRLLGNKSRGGLGGLADAVGVAGAAALPGLDASNRALQIDMQDATKSRLEGLKVDLQARVKAGEMSQQAAEAKLQYDYRMAGVGAQYAGVAVADAQRSDAARQRSIDTNLQHLVVAREAINARYEKARREANYDASRLDALAVQQAGELRALEERFAPYIGRPVASAQPGPNARIVPNSGQS